MRDLVVLTADLDTENALKELLFRDLRWFGIRMLSRESVKFLRHRMKDSGCFTSPEALLRGELHNFRHALVVFDRHGCNAPESLTGPEVEMRVVARLEAIGWIGRASAVVIEPELEAWVFSDSPKVDEAFGWRGKKPSMREWLIEEGLLVRGEWKPKDPKEAMGRALRKSQTPLSAKTFATIAKNVSVKRCVDPSFQRLLTVLKSRFPLDVPPTP